MTNTAFIEGPTSLKSRTKRKPIFGVGINDASYEVHRREGNMKSRTCPYYVVWTSMLTRCYSSKYHKLYPTYSDCTMCPEWCIFSNFKGWMKEQSWQGKQLDKDLRVPGNTVYSPNTCIFVSREVNGLFIKCTHRGKVLKFGARFIEERGVYRSVGAHSGTRAHIGYFSTKKAALLAALTFKAEHTKTIANEQTDSKVKEAVLLNVALLNNEIKRLQEK